MSRVPKFLPCGRDIAVAVIEEVTAHPGIKRPELTWAITTEEQGGYHKAIRAVLAHYVRVGLMRKHCSRYYLTKQVTK